MLDLYKWTELTIPYESVYQIKRNLTKVDCNLVTGDYFVNGAAYSMVLLDIQKYTTWQFRLTVC